MTGYASPLLGLPGAVPALGADAGVPAHYGSPLREQRRLAEERAGFVDLSHRGVLCVTGPDRLSFLHALTSQHLQALPPHTGTTALVLSPQGRVEHALYGVDDGAAFWAHVEPGTVGELVGFLDSIRFLTRVEVADATDRFAVVWRPDGLVPDGVLGRRGADSLDGAELFLPRAELAGYAARGGPAAGTWAVEALRIAARLPRLGFETDHKTIPNELGWLGVAVHLAKGCYRGQETVARVHTLGRPPRRLTFCHLDGSTDDLPAPGTPVTLAGREVGVLTSSALHYELGPIGLALLKRSTPVEQVLDVGGVPAAQEVVVDPDAGLHVRPALR